MSQVKLASVRELKIPDEALDEMLENARKKVKKEALDLGVYALLDYRDIGAIEGKILTVIDASVSDAVQRKAMKDIVRNIIWFDWVQSLDRTDERMPVGKPDQTLEPTR